MLSLTIVRHFREYPDLCLSDLWGLSFAYPGRDRLACPITVGAVVSTHWSRDKISAISQTTFSNAYPWMQCLISITLSRKFLSQGQMDNIPALVLIMVYRRQGDKPLFEPTIFVLLTHIGVTRSQWGTFDGRMPVCTNILRTNSQFINVNSGQAIFVVTVQSAVSGNGRINYIWARDCTR